MSVDLGRITHAIGFSASLLALACDSRTLSVAAIGGQRFRYSQVRGSAQWSSPPRSRSDRQCPFTSRLQTTALRLLRRSPPISCWSLQASSITAARAFWIRWSMPRTTGVETIRAHVVDTSDGCRGTHHDRVMHELSVATSL